MRFQVKNALSAEELTEINDALEGQNYVDGREAAANAAGGGPDARRYLNDGVPQQSRGL